MKIIKDYINEIWQILNRELGTVFPLPDVLVIAVNKKEWGDVYRTSIREEERERLWLREEIKKGKITIEEYMSLEIHSPHAKIDYDPRHGGLTCFRQRSSRLLVKELPKHERKGFVIPFLTMCSNHRFVSVINEDAVKSSVRFNKKRVSFSQLCSDIETHELIHVYELVRVKAFPEEEFKKLNHLITNELFGFTLTLSEKS